MKQHGTKYRTSIQSIMIILGILMIPFSTEAARVVSSGSTSQEPAQSSAFSSANLPFFSFFTFSEGLTPSAGSGGYLFQLFGGVDLTADETKLDTTVTYVDQNAPQRMFLDQNYPNPCRQTTSIKYGIPRNSTVTVTIHTLLGSPVKTLVTERQKAGIYTVNTSELDLMPGMYFYRLQTEYGTLTRRMTITE